MSEQKPGNAGLISWIVVLAILAGIGVAVVLLQVLGDWETYGWGLRLTRGILAGVAALLFLLTLLTRATIFGWSFRKYFRWAEDQMPAWTKFRPTKAPWPKSGKVSFSFTLAMVLVTGAFAITAVVMLILYGAEVTSYDVTWWVIATLGSVWWVTVIVLVLVRIALFGVQRQKALRERQQPPEPTLVGGDSPEQQS